ncbi:MAG: ribonuclease H-like domain-containing protein [Lachnospiraceae bacterium]|nr:ribonuclease H-like domain-containing protein [Lachnospiraceae bacterium]
MQEIRQSIDLNTLLNGFDLSSLGDPEKLLMIDIETTGLSRETTSLYLIGAGYFTGDEYQTVQWFAEHPREERFLLEELLLFAEGFDTLVQFNGTHFDLPYLAAKEKKYGLPDPFKDFTLVDLYQILKPFKKLLGLQSLKQRDVERFLDVCSDDPYTGRDLIHVYYDHVRDPSEELLKPLLYHNSEDLCGMVRILPILRYTGFQELEICYVNHTVQTYRALSGEEKQELIAKFRYSPAFPRNFRSLVEGICFLFDEEGQLSLRVPVYETELKRFYENYRDYYYLPLEDTCILKSVAEGVPKEYRERAKKDNCYTKAAGLFVPFFGNSTDFPLFSESRKDKQSYIPLSAVENEKALVDYASALIRNLVE